MIDIEITTKDANYALFTNVVAPKRKKKAGEHVFMKIWALWLKNAVIVTPDSKETKLEISDAFIKFIEDVFGKETSKGT